LGDRGASGGGEYAFLISVDRPGRNGKRVRLGKGFVAAGRDGKNGAFRGRCFRARKTEPHGAGAVWRRLPPPNRGGTKRKSGFRPNGPGGLSAPPRGPLGGAGRLAAGWSPTWLQKKKGASGGGGKYRHCTGRARLCTAGQNRKRRRRGEKRFRPAGGICDGSEKRRGDGLLGEKVLGTPKAGEAPCHASTREVDSFLVDLQKAGGTEGRVRGRGWLGLARPGRALGVSAGRRLDPG